MDVFQIFDDDGFFAIIFKEPFQIGVLAAFLIQQVEDQSLLLTVKGDDAKREALVLGQLEPPGQTPHDHTSDGAGLVLVSTPHATGMSAIYLVQFETFAAPKAI